MGNQMISALLLWLGLLWSPRGVKGSVWMCKTESREEYSNPSVSWAFLTLSPKSEQIQVHIQGLFDVDKCLCFLRSLLWLDHEGQERSCIFEKSEQGWWKACQDCSFKMSILLCPKAAPQMASLTYIWFTSEILNSCSICRNFFLQTSANVPFSQRP